MRFLVDGSTDAPLTLALAHGAGAAMDTPFMNRIAARVAARGFRVARFEFPYMTAMRDGAGRRPPDRAPVLIDTWRQAIASLGTGDLVIGGKSLGGRIATMIADEAGVRGVACLGYPFHPPGKPERTRTDHLAALATPTLICQGTRDPLGTAEEVAGYELSLAIRLCWIDDGDHSFKPRQSSGRTVVENLDAAAAAVADFLETL